uniref:Uncharacterized protein n=1 Tax=Oryza meridionalis TaxID=40149 RepID=A0A0E0F2M9_9ORYZ
MARNDNNKTIEWESKKPKGASCSLCVVALSIEISNSVRPNPSSKTFSERTCSGFRPSSSLSRDSVALGLGRTYGDVTASDGGGSERKDAAATRRKKANAVFVIVIAMAGLAKSEMGQWG